jgi:hypothetical protein
MYLHIKKESGALYLCYLDCFLGRKIIGQFKKALNCLQSLMFDT